MDTYTPDGSRVIHRTSVDLSKRHISDPIHIVQYDNKLPIIEVHIYNDGDLYNIPDNAVINIRFGKPDYTFVYNPAIGISSDKTKVYFEVTAAMTEIAGEYTPIIEIQSGSNVGGTSSIPVNVDKNPITNGMIESTTEFKLLVEYVNKAKGYAEDANTSETNAKTSETNAKSSETKAAASATAAKSSETNSKASETAANISAVNAKDSETKSKASETAAKSSETKAKTSETNAKSSETKAKTSETNAKTSETNAKKYLDDATKLWNDETTALNAAEETRKQNEIGRQTNETKRENQYNKMVTATTESVEATNNAVAIKELVETKLANGEFKGDTGPKGEKGDTGPKGEKGEPGNASESINDDIIDKMHSWSSDKTNAEIKGQVGVMVGSSIKLPNSYNGGLLLKELQGKSVQNGTPTPEAPVDIVSVGDNGSVVVKKTGKNLINNSINSLNAFINTNTNTVDIDSSYRSIYLKVKGNTTYTVSKTAGKAFRIATSVDVPSSGSSVLSTTANHNGTSITITTENNANYLLIMYWSSTVDTIDASTLLRSVQVELGATATTYEQYKEQLVTIPLTQPLRSVGSVYDRGCVKVNSVWGNERKFASITFDGSSDENIVVAMTNTTGKNRYALYPVISAKPNTSNDLIPNICCDRFKAITPGQTYNLVDGITVNTTGYMYVYLDSISGYTLQEFRAWLQTHPLTVVYELATSTFEPYSQNLQDTLNKLQSNNGVTNIFTTDPQQPTLSVEYGKTDTSALSLYANNIQDSKANKVDIPTKLPADGGNADTVDGKHASDFMTRYNAGAVTTFDTFINAGVYRIQEISEEAGVPIGFSQYGQLLVLNGDNSDTITQIYCTFDTNAIFSRSCHSWGKDPSNWTEWEKISNVFQTYDLSPNNADEAPTGISAIRPGGTNNPFNFFGTLMTFNHNDIYKQQIALPWGAGETRTIKYRVRDNGIWYEWKNLNNDSHVVDLPSGSNILNYVEQTLVEDGSVTNYRIQGGVMVPTNLGYIDGGYNNDFYYTVYKLNSKWIKVLAIDVRSHRTFWNFRGDPSGWVGWVEDVKTDTNGGIYARKEQGGTQSAEGGQLILEQASTSTLGADFNIDVLGDYIRFFGGTYGKGAFLDIGSCSPSVGDRILTSKNVAVGSLAPASPLTGDIWIW